LRRAKIIQKLAKIILTVAAEPRISSIIKRNNGAMRSFEYAATSPGSTIVSPVYGHPADGQP
jgi:hypothetical protein